MDLFSVSRKKASFINMILILVLSMPCVLGFNLWSGFQPRGEGTTIMDLEDFIVSNLLLPIGSLVYLLFCTTRFGWGFSNYRDGANRGQGMKVPKWIKGYVTFVLPILIIVLIIQGL